MYYNAVYCNRYKNMEKTILNEVYFFAICAVNGFIIVMLYDILRWFRGIIKHNKIVETIEDLLYGICTGFRIFVVIYKYNDGILRAFLIIAIALGICGYHFFKKCIWWIKLKD